MSSDIPFHTAVAKRLSQSVLRHYLPSFSTTHALQTRQKVESSRHLIHSNSLAKLYNPKLGFPEWIIDAT